MIALHGLSEAQQRALRIADNKIALNAGWDTDLLRVELQALVVEDIDVGSLGFASGEIDVILSGSTSEPDDDLIPDLPEVAFTQPGGHLDAGRPPDRLRRLSRCGLPAGGRRRRRPRRRGLSGSALQREDPGPCRM